MMNEQQKAKCKLILEHYGIESQKRMLIEECAELIQAVAKMKENGEIDKKSIQELNCKEIEVYDIGEPSTDEVYGFAFPHGYDISNAENKYTAVADICMQICEHQSTRADMIVRLRIDDCIVNTIAIHDCESDSFTILDDFDEGNKSIVIELITSVSMASDFLSKNLPPFNA